jgi:hypothetical protein
VSVVVEREARSVMDIASYWFRDAEWEAEADDARFIRQDLGPSSLMLRTRSIHTTVPPPVLFLNIFACSTAFVETDVEVKDRIDNEPMSSTNPTLRQQVIRIYKGVYIACSKCIIVA